MGILDPLFGSPDLPPPPDYTGAAEATAEGNLEASRAAATANRYDQFTPFGDMTWTNLGSEQFDQTGYDAALASYQQALDAYNTPTAAVGGETDIFGNPVEGPLSGGGSRPPAPVAPDKADFTTQIDQDKWRSDITLSPEVQALFDKGLMMQDISADIGLTAGGQIRDTFSDPFSLDPFSLNEWNKGDFELEEFSLGDFEGYREDVYDAMLERLETDINKDWQSRNAELYAGGIGRGTEAYGWEQTMRDRKQNDARLQAYQSATDQALRERQQEVAEWQARNATSLSERGQGFDEWYNQNQMALAGRGQGVKEALLERNQPLNEYNAWRTGAQVDLPTFQPGGQQQTTAGPNYLGAAGEQAQYDLAGYNADVMGQNALMSGLFSLGAGGLMGGYF